MGYPGDSGVVGQGVGVDQRFNAKHFAQQFGGQHFMGRAAGDEAAGVDHVQAITERGGQVQVVDAGQGADAQALDQPQQLKLIARIEVTPDAPA